MERCARCGLNMSVRAEFCPACGIEFQSRKPKEEAPPLPAPPQRGSSLPIPMPRKPRYQGAFVPAPLSPRGGAWQQGSESSGLFGAQSIQGVVIHVEGPYMVKPTFNWVKLLLFILFLPVIVGAGLAFAAIYAMFSLVFGSRSGQGGGLFSNLSSQVLGFFLTGKLFGPKDQVPVRDIRLRLQSGEERLARVKGELVVGNFNVGDEVSLRGFMRGGTLMVTGGHNLRTNSEIRNQRR